MKKENKPQFDEREMLLELYSFPASNGKFYRMKPAPMREVLSPDSDFMTALNGIGVPQITSTGNPRLLVMAALQTEEKKKFLAEIIEKYVEWNNEKCTLEQLANDNFTVDDFTLMIKKFAGISG